MNVVLIAGPTASGKSSAAIGIAKKHNGVIVNADSMQVYSVLDVLTSRPSRQDEAQVEHKLYGYMSPDKRCSVARWLNDVEGQIGEVIGSGKLPIIVGGTGLYFKALEFGLTPVPEVPEDVRNEVRSRLEKLGPQVLHKELAEKDHGGAEKLKENDGQRIARALEVVLTTGKSLEHFHKLGKQHSVLGKLKPSRYIIMPDREALYKRINLRFVEMVDAGGLDEVIKLRSLKISSDLPAMKAIGVRALGGYLDGDYDLEKAIEMASQETRNYAKRQMTWLRNQMGHWPTVSATENFDIH